jgi:hypothetical protein
MVGAGADMKACSIAFLEVDKKTKTILASVQIDIFSSSDPCGFGPFLSSALSARNLSGLVCKLTNQQRSSPQGKNMIFGENGRIRVMLAVAVFGPLLVHSAAAQESSASVQSAVSLAKSVNPSGLAHGGVQPAPFQSNKLVRSLAMNQHALMSAPPPGISLALANANLPPTSPRRFSLPGVSKANFLAPTAVQPSAWKYFNTPGANASELRSEKHPNLGNPI